MTKRAFNVWIELEEVEVVDGSDMHYHDRSDELAHGVAGRFDTLLEAVAFANRLWLAGDPHHSLGARALEGLSQLHARYGRSDTATGTPEPAEVTAALYQLMNELGLEVH